MRRIVVHVSWSVDQKATEKRNGSYEVRAQRSSGSKQDGAGTTSTLTAEKSEIEITILSRYE